MSGFVVIYNRDGHRVEPAVLARMMTALEHRGPNGSRMRFRSRTAIGHLHFWTTPEEVGERQPLSDPDDRYDIAFDGRIDNRDELLAALEIDCATGRQMSDASIVLSAYQRWEDGCFERLLGPFAVAVYDSLKRSLICARDMLGDRTLFYYLDRRAFIVASEEKAILDHPLISNRVDEVSLANFFALRAATDGRTFFADVHELLPAHAVSVDAREDRTRRFGDIKTDLNLNYRSDDEYAERFRWLLAEAVKCRLRCVGSPAVLMSGGLDSTSVAAIAAREKANDNRSVRAVSWVFDELATCDERPYINALANKCGIETVQLACDHDWPLSDIHTWPWNPNNPVSTPYRRIYERVYRATRELGTQTVLTGYFGDELYSTGESWLIDLLKERRILKAASQLAACVQSQGIRGAFNNAGVRYAGRQIFDRIPYARSVRPEPEAAQPDWLTPRALAKLTDDTAWLPSAFTARRPDQHRNVIDMHSARAASVELFYANQLGIDLRHPYRDRRLIEFMLAIPAHQIYRPGRARYVLRRAMTGLLPEKILARADKTSILPLYRRGVFEREKAVVERLLNAPDAMWSRYVRPDWLLSNLADRFDSKSDGASAVVAWQCLSLELWRLGNTARASAAFSTN